MKVVQSLFPRKALASSLLSLMLLAASAMFNAGYAAANKVNINTASAEQIASVINGVGVSKAQAIVEYRKKHGKFKKLQDLQNVDGIGSKTIEKNRDKISL